MTTFPHFSGSSGKLLSTFHGLPSRLKTTWPGTFLGKAAIKLGAKAARIGPEKPTGGSSFQ
jgi:hypothetical protein